MSHVVPLHLLNTGETGSILDKEIRRVSKIEKNRWF
jgi:hypothetical protein